MSISIVVSQNIRKWREFKGVKQETLAKQMGLSKAALSQIENGRVKLTLSRIEQIANLLEIEFEHLMYTPQQLVEKFDALSPFTGRRRE